MSEVRRLLEGLHDRGVRLKLEAGDQLKVRAPKGALTPEFTHALKTRKDEIIAFLGRRQQASPTTIPIVSRAEPLPLSPAQQRLWFLERLQQGEATYNISAALDLLGTLSVTILERCIRQVLERHEILRIRIEERAGQPMQRIVPLAPFTLKVEDLSEAGEVAAEALARERAAAESALVFDLATGPLFRVRLLRLAARRHVVLATQHHMVSDGWSVGILVRELGALYAAFSRGLPSPLQPLPVQYVDIAAWQHSDVAVELRKVQGAYWRERLARLPSCLELPSDRPRPKVRSGRGGHVALDGLAHLGTAVARLGRETETTPFMILQAAFACLLGRYSGSADLAIGTPIANRSRPETEPLIGLFVNTLVLHNTLGPADLTFRRLVRRVRTTVLEAFDHADLPFEEVVRLVGVPRDTRHSPLFQVMFSYNTGDDGGLSLPGLTVSAFDNHSTTAKFDLTLVMTEGHDGLGGRLEFSRDLFDLETVIAMGRHFVTLLDNVVHQPDRPWLRCPMIGEEEFRQIANVWGDTTRDHGDRPLVPRQILERAASRPEAMAIRDSERELTYFELVAEASRLAHHLIARGAGRETTVGVVLNRSADLVVAQLAILLSGAAYVPMDVSAPLERLRFIADDAGLALLIVEPALVELTDRPTVLLERADAEVLRFPSTPPQVEILPDQAAYLIYTSGSTGQPKGVVVPHRQLRNLAAWYADDNAIGPGERGGLISGLAFDAVVLETWPVLASGACIVVPPSPTRLDVEALRDWIVDEHLTHVFVSTPMAELLFALDWPADSALRRLSTGGDTMHRHPPATLPFEVVNNYGPTEATVISTSRLLTKGCDGVPEIGGPIDNGALSIFDATLQPVPDGIVGQLYVGGAGVGRGYRGRPARTALSFIPDPLGRQAGGRLYATGDWVRRRQGRLEFHGRADHQVKIRGIRIELGEIESTLVRIDGVREAVVQVHEDEPGARHLVAWCTAESGHQAEDVLARLRQAVPNYMVPRALEIVQRMPLTANGKLDRVALALRPPEVVIGDARGPRTAIEGILHGIFAEVLGIDGLGIDDDFFDLGGHSLMVTRVVSRIAERLAVDLPVRTLFEAPTVLALADRLASYREGPTRPPIRALAHRQNAPLSFAQQRLWFLEELGGDAYGIPVTARLEGPLNRHALARTFALIVERHESLRTVFVTVDGQPVQHVTDGRRIRLEYEDWCHLGAAADATVAKRLAEEARRPFDLARGPLFRVRLLGLAEDRHVLALHLHHIVADGWSLEVLIAELGQIYSAFAAGQPSPLAPPALQYGDFAVWQRTWLESGVMAEQLGYWTKQLAGARSLEWPTDHPASKVRTMVGDVVTFSVEPEVSTALLRLGRSRGATPFMTVLAAFQVLLARYCGRLDVIVGCPVANRGAAEAEKLIGFFVNTMALRTQIDEDEPVVALLERVRDATLDAWTHQDVPFEKVVEAMRPGRAAGPLPFQQAVLTLDSPSLGGSGVDPRTFGGLELIPLRSETRTAKFDLSLGMRQRGAQLVGEVEYSTDLFEKSTIERFCRHFRMVLARFVEGPRAAVGSIGFLEPEEERQLRLGAARDVAWGPLVPVPRLVQAVAAAHPDAIAVIDGPSQVAYGELNRRANRLAHALLRRGASPSRPVLIWLDRSVQLIVGQLAILKCGAAYLPLDPGLPAGRLARIIKEARPRLLVTDAAGRERSRGNRLTVVLPDVPDADLDAPDDCNPDVIIGPENLAYVIYTSGSTGRPKGVCVSHGSLSNLVAWNLREFGLSRTSRGSLISSPAFDTFVEETWPLLCVGASLAVVPAATRLHPERLQDWLIEMEVTHADVPTSLAERLVAMPWPDDAELRVLRTGGDRLKRYPDAGLPFLLSNNYGPTECTVTATSGIVESPMPGSSRAAAHLPDLGTVVANVRTYVLDARGRLMPEGISGELYIGGAGVAMGYWDRSALTAEVFVPDPFGSRPGARLYRTGDIVRLRCGRLAFLGRTDQQMKIRGFRIEPGEIEGALLEHPEVAEALVLPMSGGQHVVAYLVFADGLSVGVEALRQALVDRLPGYMVPRGWVVLDRLPLTVNGKIDHAALPTPEWKGASRPPQTPTEQRLGMIFQRLLKVPNPGAEDDFFDLGGHSLLVVDVLDAIASEWGKALPLATFFDRPTIASLAALLDAEGVASSSPLVPLQPVGDHPALFLVHDVGGTVWSLRELAERMGLAQPVFGLQAVGLAPGETPLTGYAEMARLYLRAMRRVRAEGPYYLGGYSIGGVIALEMAQQLRAAGERVDLLCLLDSHLPAADGPAPARDVLPEAPDPEDGEPVGAYRERLRVVRQANIEAHDAYHPCHYDGPTVLLAAKRTEAPVAEAQRAAWSCLTPARRRLVPGDHRSMLEQEGVAVVARILAQELSRARTGARETASSVERTTRAY